MPTVFGGFICSICEAPSRLGLSVCSLIFTSSSNSFNISVTFFSTFSSVSILSLHILFTSSNLAIISSLELTSYGWSILEATASRNIDTVMDRPIVLELFPETTCLVFPPSLWSFRSRVITAKFWSCVTRLSWILSPWSCASPRESILFHMAECELRVFSLSMSSLLLIFLSFLVWISPILL